MQTARERAAFEAGIKLGALYHQWVGAPVSAETAESLERAIEKSVALQPHVLEVKVRLERALMAPNRFGYSELRGEMLHVLVTTGVEDARCTAALSPEEGYPLMKILRIESRPARP